jgi:carboxymethylenebutenolidase
MQPVRIACIAATLAPLCLTTASAAQQAPSSDDHPGHSGAVTSSVAALSASDSSFPAGADDAAARLARSPRHSEWAMVPAGQADSVRAWVVYPERRTKAPVVVVIHEIFGLSTWIRAVADQLAADGFIAIAPDFLSGKGIPGGTESIGPDSARALIRTLDPDDVQRRIDATARYAMGLPAALPRYAVVGFCWGGAVVFEHAVHAPKLGAAVVYYGTSPEPNELASVRAPVLGLYGEDDARVNVTVPPADSALQAAGKTFEHVTYPGAGHGFLREQGDRSGANLAATKQAWPRTVAWFREHLAK